MGIGDSDAGAGAGGPESLLAQVLAGLGQGIDRGLAGL